MERCGFCSSSLLQLIRNRYGHEKGRQKCRPFSFKETAPRGEGLFYGSDECFATFNIFGKVYVYTEICKYNLNDYIIRKLRTRTRRGQIFVLQINIRRG